MIWGFWASPCTGPTSSHSPPQPSSCWHSRKPAIIPHYLLLCQTVAALSSCWTFGQKNTCLFLWAFRSFRTGSSISMVRNRVISESVQLGFLFLLSLDWYSTYEGSATHPILPGKPWFILFTLSRCCVHRSLSWLWASNTFLDTEIVCSIASRLRLSRRIKLILRPRNPGTDQFRFHSTGFVGDIPVLSDIAFLMSLQLGFCILTLQKILTNSKDLKCKGWTESASNPR